jgi:hypothetical protein
MMRGLVLELRRDRFNPSVTHQRKCRSGTLFDTRRSIWPYKWPYNL